MECDQIDLLLTDFLAGELPAGTAAEVRRHAVGCAVCRKKILRQQRISSRLNLSSPVPSTEDWLDRMERRLPRKGLWSEMLRGLLLPREKKIPILTAFLILLFVVPAALHQIGCEQKKAEKTAALPAPTPAGKEQPVRLKKSSHGSVLILDEGSSKEKAPAGGEGLNPSPQKKMPDYRPFQDQQIKLFVPAVEGALPQAVKIAQASGGQVIDYAIKGFENMGPNEKTLVFDMRTYRAFLEKLGALGRIEHPRIIRSDYVTVRLTVLPEGGSSPK